MAKKTAEGRQEEGGEEALRPLAGLGVSSVDTPFF